MPSLGLDAASAAAVTEDQRGNLAQGPVTAQPTSRPKPPNGVKLISARETVRTLHLPLGRMVLCLDCETCFEIGTDRCPVCGSGTWASVARAFSAGDMTHEGHRGARSAAFER